MARVVAAIGIAVAVAGCRQVLGLHDLHEVDAGGDAAPDAPGPMVMLSGGVTEYDSGIAMSPSHEVMMEFRRTSDDKPLASAMSTGSYMMMIPEGSDGYVFVHGPDTLDTFQYMTDVVTVDTVDSIFIFTRNHVDQLATSGATTQGVSNGFVMFIVERSDLLHVAMATVSANKAGNILYAGGAGGVDPAATATDGSGLAFDFNATTGSTVFTVMHSGNTTLRDAKVRGGSLVVAPLITP